MPHSRRRELARLFGREKVVASEVIAIALFSFGYAATEGAAVSARNRKKKCEGLTTNLHSSLAVFYVEQVALNRHDFFLYSNATIELTVMVSKRLSDQCRRFVAHGDDSVIGLDFLAIFYFK